MAKDKTETDENEQEDEFAIIVDEDEEEKKEEKEKKPLDKKKLILIASIVGGVMLVLAIIFGIYMATSEDDNQSKINPKDIRNKLNHKSETPMELSKIENMIEKANMLYKEGNRKQALNIYETVSSYSEAISKYNLGVAQMKDGNFKDALEAFKIAITNQDNRCVSAINAAVCAYKIQDYQLFDYYIDLAEAYLPSNGDSPLYSYYFGLINYYKGLYYEALAGLTHPTSKYYKNEQAHLKSKIYTLFNDDINAIRNLEAHTMDNDHLPLGLLYARIGDYDLSLQHLDKALQYEKDTFDVKMCKALVYLKKGEAGTAKQNLQEVFDKYGNELNKKYPIKVILRKELFDINEAQEIVKSDLLKDKKKLYEILLYFAPYKVFNAQKVISFIKKGNINAFIDESEDSKRIFSKSSTLASVNLSISKAIKDALDYKLLDANARFKSVIDKYPLHSILHYNLALTYGQMGDYNNAYKHFIKSYHLNTKNYLAGVFAVMMSNLIHKDNDKLITGIKRDLNDIPNNKVTLEIEFYLAMIKFIDKNYSSMFSWLEKENKTKPLYLALDILSSQELGEVGIEIEKAKALKDILPQDVVANGVYQFLKNKHLSTKEFAKKIQIYLKNSDLNLNSILYGPQIARYTYINLGRMAGQLYYIRDTLKKNLVVSSGDPRGILQALALTDIYLKKFEEAYVLYNKMIDELKMDDTITLFMASIASIGANHPENAIVLLELIKLTDKTNLETRYGLGLLYQEANNLQAAMLEYQNINNKPFQSEYFDFYIDKE